MTKTEFIQRMLIASNTIDCVNNWEIQIKDAEKAASALEAHGYEFDEFTTEQMVADISAILDEKIPDSMNEIDETLIDIRKELTDLNKKWYTED